VAQVAGHPFHDVLEGGRGAFLPLDEQPDWCSSAVAMPAGSLCFSALARIFSISWYTDWRIEAWLAYMILATGPSALSSPC
jgi:hypothetical protein